MPETYYRTGAAAKALGLSSYQVRRLAERLIEAEFSGNQWRIPASEINRWLKEGVPDVPAAGGDEEMAPSGNGSARCRVNGVRDRDADPHRAAGKERDLIEAYAGAARKQAKLEVRQPDWRLLELDDRFRQREDEIQTRHGKRESEVQHADWLRAGEKTALALLDIKAPGAPPQMRLDLHKEVRERFASLNPIPADQVTGELIRDTVQPFLDRHHEQKEAEEIIKQARDFGLPRDARAKPWERELSQWQTKLVRTIVERLGEGDHPLDTFRRVAKDAVAEITREFQAHQAGERDRELRERVKASARYSIPSGLNDDGRELAVKAIAEVIDRQPPGTPEAKLKVAADEALKPFHHAVA